MVLVVMARQFEGFKVRKKMSKQVKTKDGGGGREEEERTGMIVVYGAA